MANLDLEPSRKVSSFRRISIGTWQTAYDPSVYGTLEVRMERALEYIERFRETTGQRLTISHLLAKAAAEALREVPEANAVLRWNRVYLRRSVSVFFQVAMTDEASGTDLSGATLHEVQDLSLGQICERLEQQVGLVRARKDPALERARESMQRVPPLLLNWVMKVLSFCAYTLNWDMRWAGVAKDAFGSIMISNVGMMGLDQAYAPLVPFSRVPIVLAVGGVRDAPVVENGAVAVGKVMKVNATFDHRFIDGFHAAKLAAVLRQWLEAPFEHFGPLTSDALQTRR